MDSQPELPLEKQFELRKLEDCIDNISDLDELRKNCKDLARLYLLLQHTIALIMRGGSL